MNTELQFYIQQLQLYENKLSKYTTSAYSDKLKSNLEKYNLWFNNQTQFLTNDG